MKNIVLVGMMGSGKTNVGRMLARKIGFKFLDIDLEVQKKNNMTINEMFEKFGEKAFRHFEEEIVVKLNRSRDTVISTGGGTILSDSSYNILTKNGDLVYLRTSPSELYSRVKGDKSRPLLKKENPQQVLKDILEERAEFYAKADMTVDTDFKAIEKVVDELVQWAEDR